MAPYRNACNALPVPVVVHDRPARLDKEDGSCINWLSILRIAVRLCELLSNDGLEVHNELQEDKCFEKRIHRDCRKTI